MLREAARRVSAAYDAALAPVGVSVAQFGLLRAVERRQPVSLTDLGRAAELDRSTIGRNVRLLQRMGLVEVARGADQREATVRLAERGHTVLADGAPLWDAAQRSIEARLGADATQQLRSLLETF